MRKDDKLTFMSNGSTPAGGATAPPTEIRRSIARMARLLGAGMARDELTPMRLTALGILRRDGPMAARALASRLGALPQSLTRILADLEAAGLLTRSRDPGDGRGYRLDVTPRAVSLMRREGARRDAALSEAMQRTLTPIEIELLWLAAKTLNKLADGWSEADPESVRP
jgi:DNA-binding MarR family transcriptional regulator